MTTLTDFFDSLPESLKNEGPKNSIAELVEFFRSQGAYHELFETLKMQARIELGLPAVATDPEEKLGTVVTDRLERALIDACRTVGLMLLGDGRIREGWMYMRPVGDREAAAEALAGVEATSENLDALIEVLVHEGVDTARGFNLSLTRLGTCNSITLFDSGIAHKPKHDQQASAELLVRHVHRELMQSLRADIGKREAKPPLGDFAEVMLQERPGLLKDGTYHLDTTHLASAVRIGRVSDDKHIQRLGLDLAHYGRNLHPQFQYPGDEPFAEFFPNSLAFYRTLLGQHVEAGLRLFRQKAESIDWKQHGTAAVEVYVDLLNRIGRTREALDALLTMMPEGARPVGIAPSLLQLSEKLGSFEPMLEHCKKRIDYLGYAVALFQSVGPSKNAPT